MVCLNLDILEQHSIPRPVLGILVETMIGMEKPLLVFENLPLLIQ